MTYTVTANFGSSATGTYGFSLTGAVGNNGQAAQFSGLPVAGATVTVAQATSTPTNTPIATNTATITPSFTPTAVTVSASQGSNPPGNSNQLTGDSNVPVQQVVLMNPSGSTVNMTQLVLSVTGSGNPAQITGVTLWANGTPINTAAFSGSTATFNIGSSLPPGAGVTYTVTANFGAGASGTFTFSMTGASGNNGQMVIVSGLPVPGATKTVSQSTATPTATSTVQPVTTPIVFPNPSTGGSVSVLPASYTGNKDVKIQIFTTAFRLVQETDYSSVPYGPLTVNLVDKWGHPLASGLYYVVIEVDGHHSVVKLLLLR